jgi:hypothetical protein
MTRLTICVLTLLATSTTSAWAQGYTIDPTGSAALNAALNDARREQNQNQQMRKAQQEFAARERQIVGAAAGEVASAKMAHRMAIKDLKDAREKAEQSVEQTLGLKAAVDEVLKAQTAYRELSEPVLRELKASAEFKEAEKKSTAAKEKMKRVQADTSLDEQARKTQVAELVGDTLAASNLERFALRKDQKVNAARERLEAAQQKVSELRKQASEKAESDPGVAAAQSAVKTAYESIKAAETKLASARSGGATQQILFGDGEKAGAAKGKGDQKK